MKNSLQKIAAAAALLAPAFAFADPSDPFTTVVTSATTNIQTYGAGLVTLAGVGVAFMIGVKYVKKIARAA